MVLQTEILHIAPGRGTFHTLAMAFAFSRLRSIPEEPFPPALRSGTDCNMRRHSVAMSLSLGVAALLATPAQAQNRGFGFFGGGGSGLFLLRNPGVQKELKLDSQQTEKVEQIAKDIQEKHASEFENIR